jgi:hypothetical protein
MTIDHERKKRVVDLLRHYRLDAFICSSVSEVLLLTRYSPAMAGSVAPFTSDGYVRVIPPEDELDLAENTTEATSISFKPGKPDKITNLSRALASPLHLLAEHLGLAKTTIAGPMQQGRQPATYAGSAIFWSFLLELPF